jgi:hypothetical protein
MITSKPHSLPAGLEGVRQQFERWRRVHRVRSRIPDTLWGAAVRMAGTCGLHRTAKTLRLDYYELKKRVQQTGVATAELPEKGAVATFLELAPSPFAALCECSLDLENAGGAKMHVHLKSVVMPDLAALSHSFWDRRP